MKQKKAMLIMVVVLAVLLALYGGLKAWNSHSEKQKKAKEDKEKVSLVDVKSLKTFAYESGGSKMSFTQKDGEWVYDEDDGVRLEQSTIKSTVKEITGLTAVRKLSEPDEKEDYGLDSPDDTVTYTAKDDEGDDSAKYTGLPSMYRARTDAAGRTGEDYFRLCQL